MKTTLLILALTASIALADTTNIQRVATKTIPAAQLDAVLDGARQMGIETGEFVTTTNLSRIFIAPSGTNFTCSIAIKPTINEQTVTSTNGVSVTTRTVTTHPVAPLTLSRQQMQGLFNAGVGVAGDIQPRVTIFNFRSITVAPQTNSTDWKITIPMK